MPDQTGTEGGLVTKSLPMPARVLVPLPSAYEERVRRARRLRFALFAGRAFADGVLLIVAFIVAYWLRYGLELGRDVIAPESFKPISDFYPYIISYAVLTLLAYQMRGLYSVPRAATWLDHMRLIVSGTLLGVSALTLGALLLNPVLPSRLVFIFLGACTIVLFGLERFGYRKLRMWFWRRGVNIRKALVVGSSVAGQRIMKDIVERPDLGYKLAGYVSDSADGPGTPSWTVPIRTRNGGLHRLGSIKDVGRILSGQHLHEVIVALPATHHAQILNIIDSCREFGVDFKLVPDLFEMRFNEVRVDALNGVPLIGLKETALKGFNLFVKRVLDMALGVLALIIAALPMLVIAAIVKLGSPGAVFFKQKRVGKAGEVFTCYKFRSMYRDAEARLEELRKYNEVDGPIFKMRNDPRLTPFGKFLRRTSLDELPQVFNILRGEMSFVGPRPPTPDEVTKYSEWHLKRLDVTPGLTGLWQVSGRSDLSFDDMVKLDIYYAENWSLEMDTMIILRTIPAVLKREGAY
jgi:exopolysaccharide biosynthesis polyprenyl glycosylphosphotransferase